MKIKLIIISIVLFSFSFLGAETIPLEPSNFDDIDAGTIQNPYQIANLSNLLWLSETAEIWGSDDASSYFIQTEDIDASETEEWNAGAGFSPIGLKYDIGTDQPEWIEIPFSGNYDGNYHSISNLYINHQQEARAYQALFGCTNNAIISNLKVESSNISSSSQASILIGSANTTEIFNCHTSGNISGSRFIGGLASVIIGNSIENSSSTTIINGIDNCGGLVGVSSESAIENCFFRGVLNTNESTNGGLVGNLMDDSSLSFCYMAGVINNSTAGALAGNIMTNAMITNCFWDYEISASSQPIESNLDGTGIINNSSGLTTAEMKTETSYTENGWDFNDIWAIESNLNEGYPFHQNQEVAAPNESINLLSGIAVKNYPNPFNPSKTGRAGTTTIELSLSKACSVKVDIINLKGQKIKTLLGSNLSEGKHLVTWDGKNDNNSLVASGLYFYHITAGNEELRKKMILMK